MANIALFIDTSGSMIPGLEHWYSLSLKDIEQADVYVFDMGTPQFIGEYTGEEKPKIPYMTMCGGTDFQPIADLAIKNSEKWSKIFILTDGYGPLMDPRPPQRVTWLIPREYSDAGEYLNDSIAQPGDFVVHL